MGVFRVSCPAAALPPLMLPPPAYVSIAARAVPTTSLGWHVIARCSTDPPTLPPPESRA